MWSTSKRFDFFYFLINKVGQWNLESVSFLWEKGKAFASAPFLSSLLLSYLLKLKFQQALDVSLWKSNVALLVIKENLKTKPREKKKRLEARCYSSLSFFFPLPSFSLLSPGQLNSESDAIQGRLWRWHICKCSNATRRYKGRITLGITFL